MYRDKVAALHWDLEVRHVLGHILGYAESMEFQKRGRPHLHRVMATDVPAVPDAVDQYVCAEIPRLLDPSDDSKWAMHQRLLHALVVRHQLHACAPHLCPEGNNRCSKGFPKPFSDRTVLYKNRPAVYRRR